MRYLVILAAIGKRWQALMTDKGVKGETVESWGIYWDQLTVKAGTCKASELTRVGSAMASSFSTALYYMREEATRGE